MSNIVANSVEDHRRPVPEIVEVALHVMAEPDHRANGVLENLIPDVSDFVADTIKDNRSFVGYLFQVSAQPAGQRIPDGLQHVPDVMPQRATQFLGVGPRFLPVPLD